MADTPAKPDKKEAILDAMLDLIVERGFHNAPMSLLSQRSGASPGVIYHYFPSKDEIIRALYARIMATKRESLLSGYSEDLTLREAFIRAWLNAYHFYRNHLREVRFLDQYLNSPYCSPAADNLTLDDPAPTPEITRMVQLFRPREQGGVLKNLPAEAIHGLSFGLAAALAKGPNTLPDNTLREVAETSWQAISNE